MLNWLPSLLLYPSMDRNERTAPNTSTDSSFSFSFSFFTSPMFFCVFSSVLYYCRLYLHLSLALFLFFRFPPPPVPNPLDGLNLLTGSVSLSPSLCALVRPSTQLVRPTSFRRPRTPFQGQQKSVRQP